MTAPDAGSKGVAVGVGVGLGKMTEGPSSCNVPDAVRLDDDESTRLTVKLPRSNTTGFLGSKLSISSTPTVRKKAVSVGVPELPPPQPGKITKAIGASNKSPATVGATNPKRETARVRPKARERASIKEERPQSGKEQAIWIAFPVISHCFDVAPTTLQIG